MENIINTIFQSETTTGKDVEEWGGEILAKLLRHILYPSLVIYI